MLNRKDLVVGLALGAVLCSVLFVGAITSTSHPLLEVIHAAHEAASQPIAGVSGLSSFVAP